MTPRFQSRPVPPPDHTAHYGPHPEQTVDLRVPEGGGNTLVVLIHGGFWKHEEDRAAVGPLADALTQAGFVVAVPEYRRVGHPDGGWPGTFDDIALFFEALQLICRAHGLRPERIVLVGHAAGAHLALWVAGRRRLPLNEDNGWRSDWHPDAVVALAGCSSLDLVDAFGLGDDAAAGLLGGTVANVPARYAIADPVALLPLGVPVTLLHGARDEHVPVVVSRLFATWAGRAGDRVRLVEFPDLEHHALLDPLAASWPELLSALK